MGIIREPLNVDFVVDPRPLTDKERKLISDFIKADKLKRAKSSAKQKANKLVKTGKRSQAAKKVKKKTSSPKKKATA